MRLIDADALNTSLENHRMPFGQGTEEDKQFAAGFNAGLNRAQYTAAYAPTITPAPRWIPVEDRLPEDGVKCLMANEEEVRVAWSTGMIRTPEGNIEIPAHYGNGMRVTHWMLLPEPPEGSEK